MRPTRHPTTQHNVHALATGPPTFCGPVSSAFATYKPWGTLRRLFPDPCEMHCYNQNPVGRGVWQITHKGVLIAVSPFQQINILREQPHYHIVETFMNDERQSVSAPHPITADSDHILKKGPCTIPLHNIWPWLSSILVRRTNHAATGVESKEKKAMRRG